MHWIVLCNTPYILHGGLVGAGVLWPRTSLEKKRKMKSLVDLAWGSIGLAIVKNSTGHERPKQGYQGPGQNPLGHAKNL
jgi:hypothetical protein